MNLEEDVATRNSTRQRECFLRADQDHSVVSLTICVHITVMKSAAELLTHGHSPVHWQLSMPWNSLLTSQAPLFRYVITYHIMHPSSRWSLWPLTELTQVFSLLVGVQSHKLTVPCIISEMLVSFMWCLALLLIPANAAEQGGGC